MKRITSCAATIAAFLSVYLSGCITDANVMGRQTTGTAVRFSTSIALTRAYNNLWEPGDKIGVYMLPAADQTALVTASDWSNPEAAPLAENKLYAHDAGSDSEEVLFAGVGDENTIVWPNSGRAVDFVAYYPWRPSNEIVDFIYPIDLSDQSSQQEIDLMFSRKVTGVSEGNPALLFEHKLTKLVFRVTDLDDLSLEGMTASVEGLPVKAGFSLVKGEIVLDPQAVAEAFDALPVSASDGDPDDTGDDDGVCESALMEAIVLPGEGGTLDVTFALEGGEKAVFTVDNFKYEAGKRYIYDIVLSSEPGEKVGFGVDGQGSAIDGWTNVEEEGDPHDILKNDGNGGGSGELGEPWASELLVSNPDETMYSISGDIREAEGGGYALTEGQQIRIAKSNYVGGIASVTVNLRCGSRNKAFIRSVRVGGEDLLYEGESSVTTAIESNYQDASFTFDTQVGDPISGQIEIIVEGLSATPSSVRSFTINTDITENNP